MPDSPCFVRIIVSTSILLAAILGCVTADDQRVAAPDAEAQDAALTTIRDVFKEEYAAAKTSEERLALAKRLIDTARDTENDPAACYVLLRVARDICLAAHDVGTATTAVRGMAARFDVSGIELELEVLTKILTSNLALDARKALLPQMDALYEKALSDEEYTHAEEVAVLAAATATRLCF